MLGVPFLFIAAVAAHGQTVSPNTASPQAIALPLRLVAGQPATLAVIGTEGHLLPGVSLDISGGSTIKTDASGRAFFNAPALPGAFLAKISGAEIFAAAAVVAPVRTDKPSVTQAPAVVSLHDRFMIMGQGFASYVDANHVHLGGQPALVLAASPLSLVILPGPKTAPGPADLTISVAGAEAKTRLTVVAFEFDSGARPIKRGKKGKLHVRVVGSEQSLPIEVRNLSTGVVWFPHGDTQLLKTSGGANNAATIEVKGIAPGDFSFSAKLAPLPSGPPDVEAARQFLSAAEPLAAGKIKIAIGDLIGRLERHPKEAAKIEKGLEKILADAPKGDLGLFLESARNALRGL